MKGIIGTMMGIGLLLLSSCAVPSLTPIETPTPAPSPTPTETPFEVTLATTAQDIVGTWHRTEKYTGIDHYLQFKTDGTWGYAFAVDKFEDEPVVEGEFWFRGTEFHWKFTSHTNPDCPCLAVSGRATSVYQLQVLANGNLKSAKIRDPCLPRAKCWDGAEWEPMQ